MNHFNLLPPEIIETIFNKVYPNDLINLRIVDKKFKQICDQFKIKQLAISNFDYPLFWFYKNDPTYFSDQNQIKISKFLNYKSIFHLDKYLKRLSIVLYENYFNISILNEFKLLEQLEMVTELNDNHKLSLDNLKIAYIYIVHDSGFRLTFDTNKLFALHSSDSLLDQFFFNYPDKILFYETDNYDDNRNGDYHKIEKFINLEYLKLNYFSAQIDRDILSKFKNLKILDLNINQLFNLREYNNLKDKIISNIKKTNSKKSKLQIYFFGVKLINQNQIKWSSGREKFNYNILEFQIKNYDLLKDNCCDMNQINYCELIKLIEIIPSSFTNKFSKIHQVIANDHIDNQDKFIKFLNDLLYLSQLQLIECGFTRSFYNKLINLVYLNELKYLKIKENKGLGLNYDFVLNLKQLKEFDTNQTINNHIDLISELFKQDQNFKKFIFKFDFKNYIKIYKMGLINFRIDSFYLDYNYKEIDIFSIKNLNLDQIILNLKNLKFKI